MKTVFATIATLVLLTQVSYAQLAPLEGESPKEKAANQAKRLRDVDTDYKYRKTMENIPDSKKSVDPWANTRAPGEQSKSK